MGQSKKKRVTVKQNAVTGIIQNNVQKIKPNGVYKKDKKKENTEQRALLCSEQTPSSSSKKTANDDKNEITQSLSLWLSNLRPSPPTHLPTDRPPPHPPSTPLHSFFITRSVKSVLDDCFMLRTRWETALKVTGK